MYGSSSSVTDGHDVVGDKSGVFKTVDWNFKHFPESNLYPFHCWLNTY
jgi:hypothetical protein